MASLFDRVAKLARSPQGKRLIQQATTKAQDLAKDPATKARVAKVRDEVNRRVTSVRGGSARPAAHPDPTSPSPSATGTAAPTTGPAGPATGAAGPTGSTAPPSGSDDWPRPPTG